MARAESIDDDRQPHAFRYSEHCAACHGARPYPPGELKTWQGRWQ